MSLYSSRILLLVGDIASDNTSQSAGVKIRRIMLLLSDIESQSFSSVLIPDWKVYLSGNLFSFTSV